MLFTELSCQAHRFIVWLRTYVDFAAVLELDLQLNEWPSRAGLALRAILSL